MKCPKCNRELDQTGWSSPHPEWECKFCGIQYYPTDDGPVTEKPAKWPTAKKVKVDKWEIVEGSWKKVT